MERRHGGFFFLQEINEVLKSILQRSGNHCRETEGGEMWLWLKARQQSLKAINRFLSETSKNTAAVILSKTCLWVLRRSNTK